MSCLFVARAACVSFVVVSTVTSLTSVASAAFVNPLVPSWRGEAATSYLYWESFTSALRGTNAPQTSTGVWSANLTNSLPGAVIAGSGNMYGAGGAMAITVAGSGATDTMSAFVLNLSTAGSEINYAGVTLALTLAGGAIETVAFDAYEIRFINTIPGFGNQINVAYTWDLGEYATTSITDWNLNFAGSVANLSLDAVSVDIQSVPTPGAIALVAVCGLLRRRAR